MISVEPFKIQTSRLTEMLNQPVLRMISFDKACAFVFKCVFIRSSCRSTFILFYLAKCVMNFIKRLF